MAADDLDDVGVVEESVERSASEEVFLEERRPLVHRAFEVMIVDARSYLRRMIS